MRADDRPEPPLTAEERATVIGFLDWQRATFAWKCSDVGPEDLRRRMVPSSNLSLLGLVRHLAEVERQWWARAEGSAEPYRWCSSDRPDADFDDVEDADIDEAFAAWAQECDRGRRVLAGADLDATFGRGSEHPASVRWLAMHMVEEYARHNGHADLLREAIDGQVGE